MLCRRTITITITESWTIVWTDDLSTKPDESNISILTHKEQTNVPQVTKFPAAAVAAQPSPTTSAGVVGTGDPKPRRLSTRAKAASNAECSSGLDGNPA